MDTSQTILLVEDTPMLAQLYEEYMRKEGYDVVTETTGKKAMDFLRQSMPAAIVLDLLLPDINGLEVLNFVHKLYPELPVIVATVTNSIDVAIEAMRRGAYDYIVKPFPATRLTVTLRNALERKMLVREIEELRQVTGLKNFHNFVGQSAAMQAVYRIIDSVAASRASVFILGESGTGKELAARAIHEASTRRYKPFIALNCGAIPQDLMESAIFGHMRGAFTGAISDQPGAARMANGGTLFLDEICEMKPEMQTKLLRFVQTGEIMPVGSNKMEMVDVRIIAATNRDPAEEVRERRFREDLFYRLYVVPIEMPPLREREDDVLMLATHFMARFNVEENKNFTTLAPEVASFFRQYEWPGNVRQLENVIRNVVILHQGPVVGQSMLPKDLKRFMEDSLVPAANQNAGDLAFAEAKANNIKPLWLLEKETILDTLASVDQDMIRAASLLEISPSTIYRKLQSWRALGDNKSAEAG
jgi:two-component system repressor protein LuxO